MQTIVTTTTSALSAAGLAAKANPVLCVHCGAPCRGLAVREHQQDFCCHGCLTVYELLQENGLGDFYGLADKPGIRVQQSTASDRFAFLDESAVRDRLVDFSDGGIARVTLHLPSIHCVACVWLLENLFKLRTGIGQCVVNFEKKEASITYETGSIQLSELAALLTSIGYEPALQLNSLDPPQACSTARSLYLKLGVAGFAFGNIMLFSICLYSGMDRFSAPIFKPLFGWVSLLLALPVMVYSAGDYWRAAWLGLRQRALTLDLPIAIGLAALLGQSMYEVGTGNGVGYLDSLTGLVFFLLIGRVFQDRTYQRLSFDRDYKSFFPLAVRRVVPQGERTVPLSELAVGDHLRLRHGELIPADAMVVSGAAMIDYSFVTGESEPVERGVGEVLYAGGRQVGGEMEIEITKPVSQSYLTSLWSHGTFAAERDHHLNTLLHRFSRGFTLTVISLAVVAGAWWWSQDTARAVRAFTSVLIVACPCALALSAPFALGTAQRLLGRFKVFVRNSNVVETLARVDSIVFDKTGTLTTGSGATVEFRGASLSDREQTAVQSLAARSTHPHCRNIAARLPDADPIEILDAQELIGSGIEGRVDGLDVCLGSASWLRTEGVQVPTSATLDNSVVHLAINQIFRGTFAVPGVLRPQVKEMMSALSNSQHLVLLSGDNDRERQTFQSLLGEGATICFEQSPADKLAAIEQLQGSGHFVMMVGDGLNDAGALRQSNVGVAVVEEVGTFSPASDIILEAHNIPSLAAILRFSRTTVSVVWASIILSLLYNVVGLAFASTGRLSPLVCAILMPLSSITVVTFACTAVAWAARRVGMTNSTSQEI